MTRADTPETRAALEKKMFAQIDTIRDPVVRRHYRQFIKNKLFHHFRALDGGKIESETENEIDQITSLEILAEEAERFNALKSPAAISQMTAYYTAALPRAELDARYWLVEQPYHEATGRWLPLPGPNQTYHLKSLDDPILQMVEAKQWDRVVAECDRSYPRKRT